jgi:hypothetical protein
MSSLGGPRSPDRMLSGSHLSRHLSRRGLLVLALLVTMLLSTVIRSTEASARGRGTHNASAHRYDRGRHTERHLRLMARTDTRDRNRRDRDRDRRDHRTRTAPGGTRVATGATPTATATPPTATSTEAPAADSKLACVASDNHISMLDAFAQLTDTPINCAMVYNDSAPDWSSWVDPWFTNGNYSDLSWTSWVNTPGTSRKLVISQNLFPASEDDVDWLAQGAAGEFESYDEQLASNLVAAGLGSSIIRLAWEANGNWYPYSIPDTPTGDAQWVQFWRNTAVAMQSVPGAHFQFDWCVNAGYRDIPLSNFYPGNDVVNIIGIDAYDSGVPTSVSFADRWSYLYNQDDGIRAVAAFAVANGKPLSIPEWGLGPANEPGDGQGGDDPAYVRGIGSVVADDNVAYQSYFDNGESAMQLQNSPQSLTAYRQEFSPGAPAAAPGATTSEITPSDAPALSITGGPAEASAIGSTSATFTFTVPAGDTATCSVDGGSYGGCTGADSDSLTGLSAGYHFWNVEVTDGNDDASVAGRDFIVP